MNPCQLAATVVLASCCPPRCVDREPAASTSIAKTLNPVQTASFFVNACLSTLIGRPLLLRRYPREFRMKKGKEKRGKGEEGERKRGLVKRFSWSNVYIAAARSKASLAPWTATSGVLRRWRRGKERNSFRPATFFVISSGSPFAFSLLVPVCVI